MMYAKILEEAVIETVQNDSIAKPIPVPHNKTDLQLAYAHCEEVTKHHSKSFHLATSFLPREKRRAIRAFYAFCRTTDDIVDVPRVAYLNLEEWRHASRRPSNEQTNPVLHAWADTVERYDVPRQYADELIDGCEMDLRVTRYDNFEQLRRYCYLVASTVGLISMHIIGSADDTPFDAPTTQASIELGIALQMTNILRDVGEDLERGRIYLPQDEMEEFECNEQDLHSHTVTPAFKRMMKFQIDRTEQLYAKNVFGLGKLKQDGRMAVGAAIQLYRGILGKIEQNDFNVFTKRAHLNAYEKLSRLPSIYAQVRGLSA